MEKFTKLLQHFLLPNTLQPQDTYVDCVFFEVHEYLIASLPPPRLNYSLILKHQLARGI